MALALTKGQANSSKTEKKHRLVAGKSLITKLFPYSSSLRNKRAMATVSAQGPVGSSVWNMETGFGRASQQGGPTLDAN